MKRLIDECLLSIKIGNCETFKKETSVDVWHGHCVMCRSIGTSMYLK